MIHLIKIVSNTQPTATHPVPRMSQDAHDELVSCVISFDSLYELTALSSCGNTLQLSVPSDLIRFAHPCVTPENKNHLEM
jgi:hypothetical protein